MRLKERRNFQVSNRIRDILLDSEIDIGTLISEDLFYPLKIEFSDEEVTYALRYLRDKTYLDNYRGESSGYKLTLKGYEEWLFPNGPTNEKGVFVSYAIEDKILANQLKKHLEKLGLSVFLAHEDIEPTAKWRDRIISDLKTCAIFVALRTKTYIKKHYTEQECGFALALNKRILSICIDTEISEMGFCSEFQGVEFKGKDRD